MPPPGRHAFFVTCAPGIEAVLHREMAELALAKVERQVGGCYFEGTLVDAMRANLWLRTAVRVLLRVARFPAEDEGALYAGVQSIDWSRHLAADGTLAVDATASQSRLDHTLFVAQKTKDAICDQFRERAGRRPDVDKNDADLGVVVHLVRDRASVLLDTSGDSLHKRGWRKFQGRAPLAETLAAALVLSSGWDRRQPLVDPFCGSGTILVEAAWIAEDRAPGLLRNFAFERWPDHDERAWQKLVADARARIRPAKKLRLVGLDTDGRTLEGTRENARAAGVDERVDLERGDALDFDPVRGWNGCLVSNPPYGERVGRDVRELLGRLGRVLTERCEGWSLALLLPRDTAQYLAIRGLASHPVANGGIPCDFVTGRLP
jgi:23S rRNA G2445 N2-methylase RlmL